MTTSGRATASSAWRRRRWKNWAAVVQLHTRMLSCAPCCRKRSRRALECSGPFPSYPCGSRSVRREVWFHFDRPATMNWSITIWAPLTKSPNCASQSTRASGADDGVAVLEAERRILRERRVVDLERRVRPGQLLDRRRRLARSGVVKDEVAVRERPALGVLARETDRDAVLEERRERERLGLAPVDPSRLDRLAATLELPGELRVHGEPGRNLEQLLVERAQALGRNGRLDHVSRAGRRRRLGRRRGRLRDGGAQPVVGRAQGGGHLADDPVHLVARDHALPRRAGRRTPRAPSAGGRSARPSDGCVYAASSCSLWPKRR